MADTTLYKQIVLEWGQDTDSLIWGMGCSPDNGEHFYVLNTTYGRKYRTEDGDRIWPFIVDKVKAVLDWSNITNEPDLALKTDLTWSNVTGKPDVALKSDVAAVSAVASNASAKATSNAATIASVSSTANSSLSVANSNAKVLPNKLDKADLTWSNITNRPDFDKIASQASQAVVTANTAQSQASAAGQAAASASTQASAAKTTADTATATANAAKASASTASATAASAQQVANSASASASATAVALKNKADTDTVNAQFTAVNSSVASAQSTADNAVAGLAGKLDKTALTWGNIANKPTNLATSENVAKAQSAANSAVSMASGATATANSAKSAATSAVGVANTANTTANSALTKANSAATVASQANSNASSAVSIANSANNSASSAINTANQAKSTADSVNSRLNAMQIGGRNLAIGTGAEYAMGYGIPTTTWKDGYAYLKLPSNTTSNEVLPQAPHTFYHALTKGTTYTQTIWLETDAKLINSSGIQITWFTNVGHDGRPATLINLGENKYKLYSTYMWPGKSDNSVRLFDTWYLDYAFDLSTGTYFKFGKLKLEEGNVSTDWTPAPEDIQSEIDANKTAAANAQSSANSAQSTANTAKSTADSALSKANSNATTLNNKVSKSDLTWANISGKPSIPSTFNGTITDTSTDFNNLASEGHYDIQISPSYQGKNGPDQGNWGLLDVKVAGRMVVQTYYSDNLNEVYVRNRHDATWTAWRWVTFWPS